MILLSATLTILPDFLRQLNFVDDLETQLCKQGQGVGQNKNFFKFDLRGLLDALFNQCGADTPAVMAGVDRQRTNFNQPATAGAESTGTKGHAVVFIHQKIPDIFPDVVQGTKQP